MERHQGSTTNNSILLIPNHSNQNPDWLVNWDNVGTTTLVGYQLWAVEQNVTDRDALLPFIIVSSGNNSDTLTVDRYLFNGTEEESQYIWEDTRRLLKRDGARLNETANGFVPVTSLPSLSPSLSIVLIPNGDYIGHLKQLYLNINLRRLGLGGRSGLKISDASPAQQLHFRQAFRLPIPPLTVYPSPSSKQLSSPTSTFADTVLDLVILVQHALSLFALGVVKTEMAVVEGVDDQSTMEGESEWRLSEGDGLLCDTTLAGLSLFRVDIGEPFLRLSPDESVLSPPLLAALMSIVISTRGKLITCGANAVPKDPFERRAKFLRACQSFQQTHSLPYSSYLTLPFLSTLSSLHARTRHPDSVSTKSKVSRALRHRLDASLSLVVDPSNVNLPNSILNHKSRTSLPGISGGIGGKEDNLESSNLEILVNEHIDRGIGGSTVGRLWGNKKKKPLTGVGTIRRTVVGRGLENEGEVGSMGPPSDSDSQQGHGFGRGVLRGVKERAGRAGRKFGDGIGLTDSTTSKPHAPIVLVSPGSTDNLTGGEAESPTSTYNLRLASTPGGSALTRTSTNLSATWDHATFNNSSSAGESSSGALGLGLPPSRRKNPKRVASEFVGAGNSTGSEGKEGVTKRVNVRKRRHSFNILVDAPQPWQNLSRKRLEMEVNLRMAVWNLEQKEKNLIEMVEALEVVRTSYSQALTSLSSPHQTRLARLELLQSQSQPLLLSTSHLSSLQQTQTSPTPLSTLLTGSSKLSYAQSLLEDKLRDVESFRERIESKIGGKGDMMAGGRGEKEIENRKSWWKELFGL